MRGYLAADAEYVELPGANRREFDRLDYRTVGTAYSPESGTEKPALLIRVWTRDVSITGAKLSANTDLTDRRLFLKLMLPQFKDTVIECDVVRRYTNVRESITGKERVEYLYGVQFVNLHQRSQLDPVICAALDQGPAPLE